MREERGSGRKRERKKEGRKRESGREYFTPTSRVWQAIRCMTCPPVGEKCASYKWYDEMREKEKRDGREREEKMGEEQKKWRKKMKEKRYCLFKYFINQ